MTRLFYRLFLILFALTALVYSTPASAALDDTCSGATTINLNTSYARTLSPSTDWYKVSVSSLGDLKVVLDGPSGSDFDLYVYSSCSSSSPLKSSESSGAYEVAQFPMSYSGYYYIKVYRYSGTGTGYGLSATVVSNNVDSASFNGENYPDGTQVAPNTSFTKTWTLYNNGTTTWNGSYYLQYQSGPMSQTSTSYISGSVPPGYSYTFSVPMVTPSSPGTYTDYWSFKSPSGTTIKVGGSNTIWAQISVVGSPNLKPYTPSGWSGPLIITGNSGSKSSGGTLYANGCGTTYISWAVENNGSASASSTFYTRLYLDGNLLFTWNTSSLANGNYTWVDNWSTAIPYGNHTLKLVTDDTGAISESNEGDNTTSQTLTWEGCPPIATITTPNGGNNFFTESTSTSVQGTCQSLDGTGIGSVSVKNDANGYGSTLGGTTNFSFSGVPLTYGSNKITVNCNGSYWIPGTDIMTITVNTPPSLTISNNGGNNFSTNASSITLTGTCSDVDGNIDYITYQNQNTGWSYTDLNPSGGNWSVSQPINLQNGSNAIFAECWDSSGKSSGDGITITSVQTGSISGTVTSNSQALPGATVTAMGPTTASTSVDSNGNYTLSGLPPGTYDVKATQNGYYDLTKTGIGVSAGSTTNVYFALTKVPKSILSSSPSSISTTLNSGTMDGSKSFVVQNAGDAAMSYTLSVSVPWISLQKNGAMATSGSFGLAAGAQNTIVVIFNSNGIASTPSPQGVITITATHNDLSQETKTIAAAMTINPPAPQPPAPAEQPAPTTPPSQPAQYGPCQTQNRCYADPVNTAIGNYLYHMTDLAIDARGPGLVFARHYNSLDTTVGSLGLGWTHSLNSYLILSGNGDVYVRWGNGRTDWYVYNSGTGGYAPPAGVYDQLVKGSVYTLTNKDQNVWVFSTEGQLQSVTDRHNNKLTLAYDAQKRLATTTNAVGDSITFAYVSDADSKLASVTDFTGRKVQFAYSGNRLSQVTDVLSKTFGFSYDSGNRLEKITERDGKPLVTNAYDSSGRVTDQYDGLNNHTKFEYNTPAAGQTTVTDPANNKHIYSYDALYRLTSQKAPTGDAVSFLYNTQNLPVEVTDTNGKKSLSAYDNRGNLTSFTDATGAKWLWTYDTLDRVTSHTTPLDQTTSYSYDTNGNLSQSSTTINSTLHTISYGYLSTGELSSLADPLGKATTYTYNGKGELTGVTNANSEATNFGYDSLHRQTSVTDPLTRTWNYAYNASDNLTSETSPLSKSSTYNYDARGQLITESHPDGTVTRSYDDAGRLVSVTTPSGTTSIGYNAINQRTSETDTAGKQTTFSYNALGYLTGITDPTGKAASFTYDAMGRLLSSTNSAGQKTTFTLDDTGRPKTITNPLNAVVTMTYNAAGEVTETKDPAQNSFKTTYDAAGRKTQVVNPLQGAVIQQYDKNSRITQLTTPAGTTVSWAYDSVGRILSQTSPSGTKRSFVYDAAGQLTSITNAGNQKTSMEYDADGKLTKTTFADGVIRSIAYDASDRPTQIAAAGKTRSYTYDSANRIASSTDIWNKTLSYTYTAAGALASITYPGNKAVSYGYDAAGRMTTVTDWLGGTTSYTYDSAGRLQQTSFPNGVKTTRSYDGASRVTSIAHKKSDGTVLYSQTIAYDNRGNITSIDVTPEPTAWTKGVEVNYTTNTEDQYTQAGSELLGYDPVGQMLTRNLDGASASYTFDARERLASITSGGATTSFTYGPEGERIERVTSTQTTRYVVDTNAGLPRVLTELDASSVPTTYYIYGVGLVARTPATGTAIQYYHEDVQSNIALLTDTSAAITDTYVYHPFGKVLAKTGTTANPYQFAGHLGVETDGTLLYMRARYYDPALGRFVSKDPIGIAGGLNLYDYVDGNPVSFTDPSGMCPMCLIPVISAYLTSLAASPDLTTDINFIAYDWSEFQSSPSFMNGAALLADVVGAAIPGATGFGAGTKSVGKSVSNAVNTMIDGGIMMSGSYGKAETRLGNARAAIELEDKGWEITHIGAPQLGMKEKYLPGLGGGTKGSTKIDVAATHGNKTINVNTVDTYADGITMTSRESRNAGRAKALDPKSAFYSVPKANFKKSGPLLPDVPNVRKSPPPHITGIGSGVNAAKNYFQNLGNAPQGGGK